MHVFHVLKGWLWLCAWRACVCYVISDKNSADAFSCGKEVDCDPESETYEDDFKIFDCRGFYFKARSVSKKRLIRGAFDWALSDEAPCARPSSNFYSPAAIVERANSTDSAARWKARPSSNL